MSGYQINVKITVGSNDRGYPLDPLLAQVERSTVVAHGVDHLADADHIGAAMAEVIRAAIDDARDQLRELSDVHGFDPEGQPSGAPDQQEPRIHAE